ncbi:unnamed protein product [Caenorhabditis auriculariae]|uniref:Protein MAK10 homolog n=1 Tax=Caenorhabditis auriculariae TaxID=2777116 RepID=A0A8S1HUH8_9PELO|nr:unnamed protein product [Caenorhabditis auriculariae]
MSLKPGVNPYTVLGLEKGCTERDIQKAYRLQCLKWHPDKNLDNKEEAEKRFIAAKEAFAFLFDKTKREEYDRGEERVRVAEEKHKARMEKADGARRKFIDELNQREKAFNDRSKVGEPILTPAQEARKKKAEELRMRSEMEDIRKQLEREANEEVMRQMERVRQAHAQHAAAVANITPKLMVKWKATADEDYDEAALRIIFEPYGKITTVSSIIIKKRPPEMFDRIRNGRKNSWGAETETGLRPGPEISAEWLTPPEDRRKDEGVKRKSEPTKPKNDYQAMSLEDLEAQILGDLPQPAEKKTKKWSVVEKKRIMEDITEEFFEACSKLELGQMVSVEDFQLGEAMSAVELMDVKMDVGMVRFRPTGLKICIDQGLYETSPQEQLTTIDATLCLFVSWLEGGSLAQTLWTNVLLPNVNEVNHPVFGPLAHAFTFLIQIIRSIIQNACCHEEEDFNTHLPYVSGPQCTKETTMPLLKSMIRQLGFTQKMGPEQPVILALGTRLELLYLLIEALLCLAPPPNDPPSSPSEREDELDDEEDEEEEEEQEEQAPPPFRPNFPGALDAAKKMVAVSHAVVETSRFGLPSPDLGDDGDFSWLVAIEPELNRRFMPSTFPRKTDIPDRRKALRYIVKLAQRILTIARDGPESAMDLTSLFYFARNFNHSGSCVLTRALLQVIQGKRKNKLAIFPQDEHVFGDPNITIADCIESTIKDKYAPLILLKGNPVYDDRVCQDLYNVFLGAFAKVALLVYQVFGCNMARQRERLVPLIEDLGNLQMEASRIEARTDEIVRGTKDCKLIPHPSMATFVFNNLLALITYHFELSFRLDLFVPYEFCYIYWYYGDVLTRWQITTMERSQEMMLQGWGLHPLAMNNSHRKRLDRKKAEEMLMRKLNLNQTQIILHYGLSSLADGIVKTTVALVKMDKIKVPMWFKETEQLRFENRIAAFTPLGPPLSVSYQQFKDVSKIDELLYQDHKKTMQMAIEVFDTARKNLERVHEKSTLKVESAPFLKVAKLNLVAARLLLQDKMVYFLCEFLSKKKKAINTTSVPGYLISHCPFEHVGPCFFAASSTILQKEPSSSTATSSASTSIPDVKILEKAAVQPKVLMPFVSGVLQNEDYFHLEKLVNVEDMFKARLHYGHKVGTLNENMKWALYGQRLNVCIFDLDITRTF